MMSTVCAEYNPEEFYKIPEDMRMKPFRENSGHRKHPCTLWLFKSQTNYDYLYALNYYLHEEYRHRYGQHKEHLAYKKMTLLPDIIMPDIGLTPFAQAVLPQYKALDPCLAYRDYFIGEKNHIAQWKNRETPSWFERRKNE